MALNETQGPAICKRRCHSPDKCILGWKVKCEVEIMGFW